jgi:hypothetical protein
VDLNLKRPDTSPSREWGDHDFDVLAGDVVVGRIMKTQVAPPASRGFGGLVTTTSRAARRRRMGTKRRPRLRWRRSRRAGVATKALES